MPGAAGAGTPRRRVDETQVLRAVADSLLSLALPQTCRVCNGLVEHHSDGVACEACWSSTKLFSGNEMLCHRCGAFFSDERAAVPVYCRKCDDHRYDHAFSAGVYEKALSGSILALKEIPSISARLARTIEAAIDIHALSTDIVIPAPLSKARRLERGFNQAELIAGLIGKALKTPVDAQSLSRSRHTPIHRIGMDQRARELTVERAFEVTRPRLISGKKILLVDDVLTSGSTASACAKVLKKNGAAEVNVFTIARAVMR